MVSFLTVCGIIGTLTQNLYIIYDKRMFGNKKSTDECYRNE